MNQLTTQSIQNYLVIKNQCNFNELVIDAVDGAFSSFGEQIKQVLYSQLENKNNIKMQDIPFKVEEFSDSIREIFGLTAGLVEMRIIKLLHLRLRNYVYYPKNNDLVFTEYMADLKRYLQS